MNKVKEFLDNHPEEAFPIIEEPHPTLRLVAQPVTDFGLELLALKQRMITTMHGANGIGLAAPQIDLSLQIFIMEEFISHGETMERIPHMIINPKIVSSSGQICFEEGCLSIPSKKVPVQRKRKISVEYFNENGEKIEREFSELSAVCFQHELDHLLGKLMTDYK